MSKDKEVATVATVETTKLKTMRVNALLNSTVKNEKLAGVLVCFGMAETLRINTEDENAVKPQTVLNKCSRGARAIRLLTEKEFDSNDFIQGAIKFINKNGFNPIREAANDKDAEFTKDMQKHYDNLLTFGKKDVAKAMPTELTF